MRERVTMRTARRLLGTAALLAAAITTACAHSAPGGTAAPTPAGSPRPTQADTVASAAVALRVESHNSSAVVIYAARGRMRQRLGMVTGTTTRTFSIPGRFAGDASGFYLVAHRVGGGAGTDMSSPTVTVQPGQTVVWTLESELPHSSRSIE